MLEYCDAFWEEEYSDYVRLMSFNSNFSKVIKDGNGSGTIELIKVDFALLFLKFRKS